MIRLFIQIFQIVPMVGTVGAKDSPQVAYILAKEVIHSIKKNKAR